MVLERRAPVAVSDAALREYVAFAERLAEASGAAILPHFRERIAVDNKAGGGGYDPVTAADREAETAIRDVIRATYPDHGIYGEEHGYEPGERGLTWVLDPIDGTRAFITGITLWGTLIALYDGEQPLLGVIDQPYARERFVGSRLGAFLREPQGTRLLETRPCASLEQAVLQSTHPEMFAPGAESDAFQALVRRVRLSRYSGDCYGYALVAMGFVDLVVESGLLPYDVQALIPVVEAAGGILTDWRGEPAVHGGQVIAAGDRRVHAAALELLASAARATA